MAKSKAKKGQLPVLDALIFVDTNIYLDFYRVRGRDAGLSVLAQLGNYLDRLIVTSQVEMEFMKNRQAAILEAYRAAIAIALTTSAGVYLWSRSSTLSAIIGISMVMSMVIAGLSGAAIPLALTKLRQDPAQSSSIVLTTVTDVSGFFSFLGIATMLLHTV